MRETRPLNPAGRLARAFLHSKLTPLLILATTLFGVLAILETPRTYNPDIVVPVVNLTVTRPADSARAMLDQVVRPLEALMASIPGVAHTYGMARAGLATVTVRFRVGASEEKSLVKVYNQIQSNPIRIPPGTRPPWIQSVSFYDVPILTLTLSTSHLTAVQLRVVAEHVLATLRSVAGVGKTWIQGAAAPAVRVWLNPARLAADRLNPQAVARAISAANVTAPAGTLLVGGQRRPLRVSAGLGDAHAVGGVILAVRHGRPVFLRDVARITTGPARGAVRSTIGFGPASTHYGRPVEPAVTLAIARQRGTDGVRVAQAVLTRLHRVERWALPAGVHVTVTRNDGQTANGAVDTLIGHLGLSILAVVAILLVFLGWREASIVALTIPLILFVVLGVGWITGQSINRITLFAFILSLGLLVDDSIVVIENIHRHLHGPRTGNFGRLVVTAANEIGRPTIMATFTVIVALLPMAFVTGMMGPFMAPIPFNAPIAMLTSLVMAYTVVPFVAYRWLKTRLPTILAEAKAPTLEERGEVTRDRLHRAYVKAFRPLLESPRRRWWFLAGVAILLGLALLSPLWQFIRPQGLNGPLSPFGVALKMLPNDNVNTLLMEVKLPAGAPLDATGRVTEAVARLLGHNRYVTNDQSFIGEAAPEDFASVVRGDAFRRARNFAQIRVNLLPKSDRTIGSNGIAREIERALEPIRRRYPDARVKILETPPGPPVHSQMTAALYGPSYAELRHLAGVILHRDYPRIWGMINEDDSVGHERTEYRLRINRLAATQDGLTAAGVAAQVEAYFHGVDAGTLDEPRARRPIPIILRLPRPDRTGSAPLTGLFLTNREHRRIALSSLARIEHVPAPRPFYTRDQHPVVYLTGHMLHSSPVYGVLALTRWLHGLKLPDGQRLHVGNLGLTNSSPRLGHYELFWLGEMRLTLDVFRDLGAAFLVAILLIYLLLVGYYRSFLLPVIVMGAIPLTLIGVFPGHWLLGEPFTATSMIGVIALAGIVIRNSLLLIDFILEHRAQGLPLKAAVLEAGAVRLRPILLTALAIILGSSVMLEDPVFGGLAISLIFGALASTVLTLFVIPLIYYLWQSDRRPIRNLPPPPLRPSPGQEFRHDHRTLHPHLCRLARARHPRPGRAGQSAFREQRFSLAHYLHRAQPAPERVYPLLPARGRAQESRYAHPLTPHSRRSIPVPGPHPRHRARRPCLPAA